MSREPDLHANGSLGPDSASRLHPDDLDLLADLLAERVVERLNGPSTRRLVTASELAEALGVSRATVYQYSALLGARRLGGGGRPRIRFDLDDALKAWTAREDSGRSDAPSGPKSTGNRARRAPTSVEPSARLLPIKARDG